MQHQCVNWNLNCLGHMFHVKTRGQFKFHIKLDQAKKKWDPLGLTFDKHTNTNYEHIKYTHNFVYCQSSFFILLRLRHQNVNQLMFSL
jgi:hypothetical protein